MAKATETHAEYVILIASHCNNGYSNPPLFYVVRTFLVLFEMVSSEQQTMAVILNASNDIASSAYCQSRILKCVGNLIVQYVNIFGTNLGVCLQYGFRIT